MSNKLLRFIVIPILLLTFSSPTLAGVPSNPSTPSKLEAKRLDPRAKILADYFNKYNSPLENQAQDFVDAADKYSLDWKLVPAISGVESTFGKASYGYNAWGWGIYGDQALGFNSWKHGIYTVSEGLKNGYINKGLTDPYSINRAYAASTTWGSRVTYFMNDMDNFADKYQPKAQTINPQMKTAGASAQLAYKAL